MRKLGLLIKILFLLLTSVCVYAETNIAQQFSSMTIDQARGAMRNAQSTPYLHEMAVAAVHSKRSDLIEACIGDSFFAGYFALAVFDEPDSLYRDEVLTKILMREWPSDKPKIGSRSDVPEPYTTLVKKYFPNLTVDDSLFRLPERRREIAVKLDGAITEAARRSGNLGQLILPSTPTPTVPPTETSPTKSPVAERNSDKKVNFGKKETGSRFAGSYLGAGIVIGLVLISGAIALFRRHRSTAR